MNTKSFRIIAMSIALLLMLGGVTPVAAQTPALPACLYFSAANHNVHGAFMQYYLARNGAENFGEPLTEAFMEERILVQYFRKAKFEFHPEYPEPFRVQVSLLGLTYNFFDSRLPGALVPAADDPNFLYFPATGLTVSFGIKKYYLSHFGFETLGYPITLVRLEGGLFVQYFQRGRVEWNGGDLIGTTVRASDVGQDVLNKKYPKEFKWRQPALNDYCADSARVVSVSNFPTPNLTPNPTATPFFAPVPNLGTSMKAQAHVALKQTSASGAQYVDVTVDDQNHNPLKGVGLMVTIKSPEGERSFTLLATDASGVSKFSFEIGKQPANSTIVVEVKAILSSLSASAVDTFTLR
ncbi:MAG: hypothetical protein HY327_08500 [Chloroflexi bacterium]|nr:hypothetical protein [Chloroflexota bacterium]